MEIKWLTKKLIFSIHNEQISEHGGLAGIRDEGLLDSALARPMNLHAYESASIIECAAAYAFGIIRNHPFQDGNKRTGFISAITFLLINQVGIEIDEKDVVIFITELAAGNIQENEVVNWLQKHSKTKP
ncbi:type II toxin-antitoxin system death-on-curing family toxin [Ekhidna sp.]|uniref:type II toxin-antitoxin system death-on-curing family toxin n=1 Tax=Ekhidna sp. TaxID=2608089 RepID=UPI0032EE6C50